MTLVIIQVYDIRYVCNVLPCLYFYKYVPAIIIYLFETITSVIDLKKIAFVLWHDNTLTVRIDFRNYVKTRTSFVYLFWSVVLCNKYLDTLVVKMPQSYDMNIKKKYERNMNFIINLILASSHTFKFLKCIIYFLNIFWSFVIEIVII